MQKHLSFLWLYGCLFFSTTSFSQQKILGFTDTNASKQIDLEKQFDMQLDPKNMDTWMKYITSHPHHVGSPQDKANAEYMVDLFKQWGYQA